MTQFTIREAAPDASSFTAVLAGSCHHGGHGVLVATGTRHSPLSGPRRRRRIPGGGLGVTQPHSLCCPAQWQELEGRMMGRRVSVRVSPVARASEKLTTLSLELTRATDDAAVSEVAFAEDGSQEDVINATSYLALDSGRRPSTRLLDPGGRRVWTAGPSSGGLLPLSPGQTQTTHLLFGPVDLDQVTALLPQCGFVTLAVVDRQAAVRAGMDEAAIASVEADVAQKGDPGTPSPRCRRRPHPHAERRHRHAHLGQGGHSDTGQRCHLRSGLRGPDARGRGPVPDRRRPDQPLPRRRIPGDRGPHR